MPKAEVGKPVPDFTATGIDGKTFKLSDKLATGDRNIVLIFSRANWCPCCIRQLVEVHEQADNFKVLNTEECFVFREEKEGVAGLQKIEAKTKTTFTLNVLI